MKQFFKFMFASMAGFFLCMVVLFFIMMGIISGLMMSVKDDEAAVISSNSILEIKFENEIRERTDNNPFKNASFSGLKTDQTPGLNDILKCISKAKEDERIKGIFINISSIQAGIATVEEIRIALLDFKKSGKFIYSYSENYSQGAYYLASVSDKMYLYPEGQIELRGLSVNPIFFKGTMEKLEIEPEIIRHGKFKSAVEPFMYDKMSKENKEQLSTFLNSVWNNIIEKISVSRKIGISELQQMADNISGRDAANAEKMHLIDKLAYFDEFESELKAKMSIDKDDKLSLVTLKKYTRAYVKGEDYSAKKIAIIYASGDIVSGEGDDDQIGSETIAKAIHKARTDSSVKAIVLRVNSPGGSALASDVIWRESVLAQKTKPLIVSMGDYAASGGYYISCAADTIVARPNTLTGSIGVFGLLFNAQNMFKNKLGITFDSVKTGKYADIGQMIRPMSQHEHEMIQDEVEKIYDTFLTHVAEGRNMNKADIDSIGQGRIWSGVDAKRLGLVDVLGGIDDAISIAAKKAGLDTYRLIALPEQKEFFEKLVEDLNSEAKSYFAEQELGDGYQYYRQLKDVVKNRGILARLPYTIAIE